MIGAPSDLKAMTTTAVHYARLPSTAFAGTLGFGESADLLQLESRILGAVDQLVEDLGAETIVDLLDDFISDAPVRLRELDALATRPDQLEIFRRTAHSFKGAAGIFGLADLVQLSLELEMATPVGSPRDSVLVDRVGELRCRFHESLPSLRSVRRQLQSRI